MTPTEFIAKWRAVELKERSASQPHFNDLCRLLGLPDPVSADPSGDWFTFEKGAAKSTGGQGWADVRRKHAFAWEYKGKHHDLDAALPLERADHEALTGAASLNSSQIDPAILGALFERGLDPAKRS